MLITLRADEKNDKKTFYEMRIDGKLIGFAMTNRDNEIEEGDYKIIISSLRKYGNKQLPYIVGEERVFTDEQYDDFSIVVGDMYADDFILGSRATLAKIVRQVINAIDNLEPVELEVLNG